MTTFNLDKKEIERWFDFDDGGRIQLKILSPEEWSEIEKQTITEAVDYKRLDGKAERFEYEKFKPGGKQLQFELFWDKVIINWENFLDAKGKNIPCTKENKLLLVSRSKKFIDKINEFLEILRVEEFERAEESPKN